MKPNFIKHIGFIVKKEPLSHDEFVNYWMNVHAPMCKRLPGLLRYSVNLVDRARFPQMEYDGFSELWFESEEALDAALASPEGKALMVDIPNFVERRYAVRCQEYQQVWP